MRKALLIAAGLALIGTSAWSQSSSRDRDDYSRGRWHDNTSRWDRDRDSDRDSGERRGSAMREDDRGDRSGRGARFFLRSGDTQLRVICGDEESTRACVDAALTMFDRMQSRSTNSPGPSSSTPSTPPSSQ